MDPAFVTARLRIEQPEGQVFAELVYTNIGADPAFLLPYNAALGNKLDNNVFKIRDGGGHDIAYAGLLSKRAKPRPEDFARIEPNGTLSTRVRIDTMYKLRSDGVHEYTIVYSAYHSYPDRAGLWQLVSNEVHFRQ